MEWLLWIFSSYSKGCNGCNSKTRWKSGLQIEYLGKWNRNEFKVKIIIFVFYVGFESWIYFGFTRSQFSTGHFSLRQFIWWFSKVFYFLQTITTAQYDTSMLFICADSKDIYSLERYTLSTLKTFSWGIVCITRIPLKQEQPAGCIGLQP